MDNIVNLCCFPYAGGNISVFDDLAKSIPENIRLIGVEYPGHGKRFREKVSSSWDELLMDMAKELEKVSAKERTIFCGYSMGSLVIYELLQRNLIKLKPERVYILSHNPPLARYIDAGWDCTDDWLIVSKMKELGGFQNVNEKILSSKYYQKMCMQPLRADLNLLHTYRRKDLEKIDINATVIFSSQDPSIKNIKEWDLCFRNVDYHTMGDDHFVLKDHSIEIADIINKRL